jgi:hypothetical protein
LTPLLSHKDGPKTVENRFNLDSILSIVYEKELQPKCVKFCSFVSVF